MLSSAEREFVMLMETPGEAVYQEEITDCIQTLINSGNIWSLPESYLILAGDLIKAKLCAVGFDKMELS